MDKKEESIQNLKIKAFDIRYELDVIEVNKKKLIKEYNDIIIELTKLLENEKDVLIKEDVK